MLRPTILEQSVLTGESVGSQESKRNDGKTKRGNDRKGSAQSTNAVRIVNVEQRHRPRDRSNLRKEQSNQAVKQDINTFLWRHRYTHTTRCRGKCQSHCKTLALGRRWHRYMPHCDLC